MKIRLMTFNIQHGRDYQVAINENRYELNLDTMANAIIGQDPDIVILNEVRGLGPDPNYLEQTKILADLTGFSFYHFGPAIYFQGKLPYGNAILSKYPIEDFQNIIIPDPDEKDREDSKYYETRNVIKSKIDLGKEKLWVLGTHVGLVGQEKINAVATIVSSLEEVRCVLMGDFNMEPHDDRLKPIQDLLVDTAIKFDKEYLTFPSCVPNIKIDYIFVTKDIEILVASVPDVVASDHRFIICDILL